ncbi:MAG: hypothetical protein JSR18_08730 [Proteobacteria bacterium]|nr:hypothetical protein [Pseudomonadota bacterium]
MTTLVENLVAGHRSPQQFPLAAAPAPADLAAAYATQEAVAHALHADIAGWKVGISGEGVPMAGPLYAQLTRTSGSTWRMPTAGSPWVVEVEIAFRMRHDLAPRPGQPYTRDDIASLVEEAIVGVELVRGRYVVDGPTPLLYLVADNAANAGYIVGAARKGLGTLDVRKLAVRYTLDGDTAFAGAAVHPQGDPFAPIVACANAGNLPLGGIRAGQVVTTGTLIKPFPVTAPTVIAAELEGIGSVTVRVAG